MRRSVRGFTLTELAVMMVVLGIFSTTLIAVLKLSVTSWTRTNSNLIAQQNVRIAMSTICTEFRQAMHPAGYLADIIVPATDGAVSSQFVFLEASPAFQPLQWPPTFNTAFDASDFQEVNYFVTNGSLYRELQKFSPSGAVTSDVTQPVVVSIAPGSLSLTVTRMAPNVADVRIVSTEGSLVYVLETQSLTAIMQ